MNLRYIIIVFFMTLFIGSGFGFDYWVQEVFNDELKSIKKTVMESHLNFYDLYYKYIVYIIMLIIIILLIFIIIYLLIKLYKEIKFKLKET